MSKREICRLVVQMMGVYFVAGNLGHFISSIGMVSQFAGRTVSGSIMMLVGELLCPVFGVLLIVLSGKIASLLSRGDDVYSADSITPVTKNDAMGLAVACIGLYFAVSGLVGIIYRFSLYIIANNSSEVQRTIQSRHIVRFCLGLWLFAGYRGFVRFWNKMGGS